MKNFVLKTCGLIALLTGAITYQFTSINTLSEGYENVDATLHYRPKNVRIADIIPFYWKGDYHVFYLNNNGEMSHIVSRDLLRWKTLSQPLEKGSDPLGPDFEGIWTGSFVENNGQFYFFYTGKNINDPKGDQKVMRATSKDFITWEKDTSFIFYADGKIYWNKLMNGAIDDRHPYHHQAFRDPHVVWNEDKQEWWMGFHAMLADGSLPVVSLYTSKDLDNWTPQTPLVIYPTSVSGDCPDLFKVGNKWNINLADYHYVQVEEPGIHNPKVDVYDCGDLRVAKTMFDGKRRIIIGWIGDYADQKDSGDYQWGGTMSMPREIYADSNGKLFQRPLIEVINLFGMQIVQKKNVSLNEFIEVNSQDYMLHTQLKANEDTKVSVLFRQETADDVKNAYFLSVDYKTDEIAVGNQYRSYKRVCEFDHTQPLDIRIFVEGTVAECFVNDAYCFTMRVYDCKGSGVSFVSDQEDLKVNKLEIYQQNN